MSVLPRKDCLKHGLAPKVTQYSMSFFHPLEVRLLLICAQSVTVAVRDPTHSFCRFILSINAERENGFST